MRSLVYSLTICHSPSMWLECNLYDYMNRTVHLLNNELDQIHYHHRKHLLTIMHPMKDFSPFNRFEILESIYTARHWFLSTYPNKLIINHQFSRHSTFPIHAKYFPVYKFEEWKETCAFYHKIINVACVD